MKANRLIILFVGTLVAFLLSYLSDPDRGLSSLLGALAILQAIWVLAGAHLSRKILLPGIDLVELIKKSAQTSEGAGLSVIGISIFTVGMMMVLSPRAHAANVPPGFATYGPMLKAEQRKYWPDHPDPALLAALIEQESCATKKMCWSPTARLKSAREEGAGFGQITRAYRADGTTRFDALAGLRNQYRAELAGWSWGNVYNRPDLQLRAIVLMSRDLARRYRAAPDALSFADAAYNGGQTGVDKERRACAMSAGCDPGRWAGHVELHCLKSRQPIYGTRSACDINRQHVHAVMLERPAKYRALMRSA
jgi:hypothetical protein